MRYRQWAGPLTRARTACFAVSTRRASSQRACALLRLSSLLVNNTTVCQKSRVESCRTMRSMTQEAKASKATTPSSGDDAWWYCFSFQTEAVPAWLT